ncbi:hypothetical protein ACFYOV_08605 [Streptomyces sp. NPDC005931]|uniref:hypothetical protein n=1 Tax=Streptomyces sp. NPDC005931 TaxID=3364737 RepID=UPI0036A763A4
MSERSPVVAGPRRPARRPGLPAVPATAAVTELAAARPVVRVFAGSGMRRETAVRHHRPEVTP